MEINIVVVIVTYNNENDIEECLSSLLGQTFTNYKVVIVDDMSTDKTVEIVKSRFPQVEVIVQKSKKFLTGCNNDGMRYSIKNYNPDFIMVLNPDTKVEKNLLQELYTAINKEEKIGAVGPKIKFYKNSDDGLINSTGLFYDGFNQAYDFGFKEKDKGQYDSEKYVFGVTGACILYRTKMLKEIGMYWTKIKLYLDEVELFIRARKAGWKVLYTPKTTVWHKYMASTSQEKMGRIEKVKNEAWFWIAMRHYSIKGKIAMIKQILF